MQFSRAAGILLHPTSLPGQFGVGDLGPAAFAFCESLAKAGQTYWQMLPLGPTGWGDSPYGSFSAFAGNTILISPEQLAVDGLVDTSEIDNVWPFPTDRVDFGGVKEWKAGLLRSVFERWESDASLADEFDAFCAEESGWLNDYALYCAIKSSLGGAAWFDWPELLKLRDDAALDQAGHDLARETRYHQFCEFMFFRQWRALKDHANSLGIKIIGDIPIFVARDSADVWQYQHQFKLNDDGSPRVVAGVPPDYFSSTGQLWGNPVCDWDAMREDGFRWWVARFRKMMKMVDIVRIDHFRGFIGIWEVPARDKTAENGEWVEVPGRELFSRLTEDLGELPVIAEDLGEITPEVDALRDEFGFPGMRILEYGFGGDAKNRDLADNYEPHTVAYTGTHDNDTVQGWFASLDKKTRRRVLDYLDSDGDAIHWDMIRALYASVADTVIIPMQDVLGLDTEARMNTPATTERNWQWRMQEGAFTDELTERLRRWTELYGRYVRNSGDD